MLLESVRERSLFGMWECDRCFGDVWNAIAFRDVGMRSLLGCGGAIAFGLLGVRSLFGYVGMSDRCFGVWECVSVALLQVVCFLWV